MTAPGIADVYPLSPMQAGLLFHAASEPESRAYVVQMRFEVTGALDEAAFAAAWELLFQRHDALRTAFVHETVDRPLQVVYASRRPEMVWTDLRALRADAQHDRVDEHCRADLARGFDLQRDVLMRLALFRTGERAHQLVWSYHHLVMDGWCLGIVQRELLELYTSLRERREPRLPAAPPYRDYVAWLERRDRDAARAYWARYLDGYEHVATVPAASRAERSDFRAHVLTLDAALTGELGALAARSRVTLGTVMLAIWGLLLARYNDADDVVVGTVVSGRPPGLDGVENTVGLFINTVPSRIALEPGATFEQVLKRLQLTAVESAAFHHHPLAEIQSASALGANLFDHVFVFENYPAADDGANGAEPALAFRSLGSHDHPHYAFSVAVAPAQRMHVKFLYDAAAYGDDDVARVAGHLETVARFVVRAPAAPVATVPILTEPEREQLARFGGAAGAPATARTIVELLEDQAARSPDAVAVAFETVRLTYRELHERANHLAARLRDEFGVRPGDRVGIMLDRSELVVIAVLAVLKSGGAYVPIDPAYPPARVAYVLRDAACRAVLTQARHRAATAGAVTVELPSEGSSPRNPAPAAGPHDLAYVLYTSGTTGEPKGCELEHASLRFYLEWANRYYFAGKDGGNFGLFSPLSFDLTVTSLFLPLLRGKTLTVFRQDAQPDEILRAVFDGRHGIDTVKLTPSHLRALDQLDVTDTPVRLAIVGGEAFAPSQARALWSRNAAMRIVNEYGPTEAAVGCVVHELTPGESSVPIGMPIAGAFVAIADRNGNAVPIGVAGEIGVGGPGLARGYRNRPELGGERFVRDAAGRRMYRTGDYGAWLANGEIAYLGRKDEQVKIRGYRVELGDVESALQRLPGIAAAVVLAQDESLTAYVESAAALDGDAVRAGLRTTLPDFMIPQRFVRVERIPLTANGKADRARLAQLNPPADDAPPHGGEPRDATERVVLEIWKNVLGDRSIGITDDFFALGGHSLKAMQVMSRIHKELGAKLDLRAFLAHPTAAATASLVRATRPSQAAAIPRAPEREHYALSHAQERLWLLHGMGGTVAYNMPKAYAYDGELETGALARALAALIDRHDALRTAFVEVRGEPRQRIEACVATPLAEVDLRGKPDPERAAAALTERDAVTPFALDAPPLLRLTVMRLAQSRYVILLTMHHIVGDGWSLAVLYRELLALYEAFRLGAPDPLPPLRIQYKDFSAWQNAADHTASETYWLRELDGVPEGLRLPYDRMPAQAERDFRGDTIGREMAQSVAAPLRELAARRGTTVSNLVLACFASALWRVARQDDFCIGMSIANRNDADLERLIGFFVNILAIRFTFTPQTTARALLDETVGKVYAAFDHQDYPFDLLVRRLNPGRHANRQPLLNVVYGFQSFRDVRVDVGALPAEPSPLDAAREFGVPFRTSKFDLCLFVSEVRGTLLLQLEYDTGLFSPGTIEALLASVEACAQQLLERPNDAIAPRAQDTAVTEYPRDATVHGLFAEVARAHPSRVAVAYRHERLTYAELDARADDLAAFLIAHGIRPEEFVGVLLDRSPEMIVALLGILKAGAAYVPLGGEMPFERLRLIAENTGARVLVTQKRYLRTANALQWECAALESFVCVDADDLTGAVEDAGGIMDPAIWEYVAREAFDDISGGGWTDSYTGEWLSREVMDGYGESVRAKLAPLLARDARVLEIGCASGISMFRLAPLAGRYVGTDLSPGIVRWSEAEAQRRGLRNVRLAALAAHDVDRLDERDFDMVILNSVIECFSGHNYLRAVLRKAITLMKCDGWLFLGNVWDLDLKPRFLESLREFKRTHPERATRAKLDRSDELYLSRAFLEDLRHELPEIESIAYSRMLGDADSELSRFGFDALIRIRKDVRHEPPAPRLRRQYDRGALVRPHGAAPVAERSGARSLAYMMYTSGTSGQPKGAMIEHRSIVRLVRDTNYVTLGPGDAVLQTGSLGFDASTFEIWGPLLNGGKVVLPEGKSFLHPADLARLIRENGVTTAFLTTGLFNQIIDLDLAAFDGLTTLLTGGEKASAQHFNRVRERYPALRLLHVYGPTENTTFSTFYHVASRQDRDVPIGQPIANSTVLVVDEHLQPAASGVPGELCVGGDGLARGYWQDAALTQGKFIPHPLAPAERVYRTGDLVRRRADGNLDFIGRIDSQVKIRGFRIELEELESVLLQHDQVTAAAVVAGDLGRGEIELAAFVAGDGLDADDLLRHVKAALPDYAVPAQLVLMPKLPLNPNGKVDRKLLVVPGAALPSDAAVAPATELEVRLADIWQRLLQLPAVGVTANFFELGGHSLKVVRMASMIQQEIGADVPLNAIFRAPTIRELAAYVGDVSNVDARLIDDPMVPLNEVRGGTPIFALPPGSGYCVAYLRLAGLLPQPFIGLAFIEEETRLEDYVRLIRSAQPDPPYVLFGYSAGGKLAFRIAQELERSGAAVSDLILFDAARYLRAVRFSPDDLREAAAEFLDGIESRVLRDKALHRLERYRLFLGDCVEEGTIAADIHLIVAEQSPRVVTNAAGAEIATLDGWRELTTETFKLYQGSGRHREMLLPPYLERNADIVRAIVPAGVVADV